jgi:hypothetical protein
MVSDDLLSRAVPGVAGALPDGSDDAPDVPGRETARPAAAAVAPGFGSPVADPFAHPGAVHDVHRLCHLADRGGSHGRAAAEPLADLAADPGALQSGVLAADPGVLQSGVPAADPGVLRFDLPGGVLGALRVDLLGVLGAPRACPALCRGGSLDE